MTPEEYKATLPKYGSSRFTKWDIKSFSTYVNLLYPHITVAPGQTWIGVKHKYKFKCKTHGEYEARAHHVLKQSVGTQCPGCNRGHKGRRTNEWNGTITASKIGQVTRNGHLVLEHVGYKQTPTDVARGRIGNAFYRYKCGNCGDETNTARWGELDRNEPCRKYCPSCSTGQRESIATHLRNPAKGKKLCQFYVSYVDCETYLKLGISNNYNRRALDGNRNNPYYDDSLTPEEHYKAGNIDLSYEHCWYLSPPFPRSWVFAVEQILLKATAHYSPKEALPKYMLETCWAGQTELRDWKLEPRAVQAAFIKLIMEIQRNDGDWYAVYQKHINTYKIK